MQISMHAKPYCCNILELKLSQAQDEQTAKRNVSAKMCRCMWPQFWHCVGWKEWYSY